MFCSIQPAALSPLKEATSVQTMQYIFQICIYLYSACSQGYSTQFTAESRGLFKMHDLLENWSRYSSLVSNFSRAFMYKATLWRQNINDACKRFRFKCSYLIYLLNNACSIWTYFVLKSTPGQHERMQNMLQKMQKLQLEIAHIPI